MLQRFFLLSSYFFLMENPNNQPKKENRGGRREGAGRPKGRKDSKSISIRIPEDVVEILDSVKGSRTTFIIDAIRAYAKGQ